MERQGYAKSSVITGVNFGAMTDQNLTDEQKVKAISSVYSNVKKLRIATLVYKHKEATAQDLAALTGFRSSDITYYLREMEENEVMTTRRESYFIYYSLTKFGKKIVMLLS